MLINLFVGRFCFSNCFCCCNRTSPNLNRNRNRQETSTSLSSPSSARPASCCSYFSSNLITSIERNSSSNNKCPKCFPAGKTCCASLFSSSACCCLRIKRKNMLDRGSCVESNQRLQRLAIITYNVICNII